MNILYTFNHPSREKNQIVIAQSGRVFEIWLTEKDNTEWKKFCGEHLTFEEAITDCFSKFEKGYF